VCALIDRYKNRHGLSEEQHSKKNRFFCCLSFDILEAIKNRNDLTISSPQKTQFFVAEVILML
jgi:hypothetical protein